MSLLLDRYEDILERLRAELVAPVFKTPAEVEAGSPLFLDMIDDARVLHDTGGFFKQYLDGFRRRLRRWAHAASGSAMPGTGSSSRT